MVESFFLITPIGLESAAAEELKLKCELLSSRLKKEIAVQVVSRHKGGLLINCEREVGFALNHWLKIPTRILLRLEAFRCRDFPKLFNKIRKMSWSNYLRKGPLEFSVSVHESRLKIKEKIAECVQQAIQDSESHQPLRKSFLKVPQTIFVRIKNDEVIVSIDTSGEPLFRRGYKLHSVDAPIRENLGAALVFPMIQDTSQGQFVDLMAGSGTLAFEALSFFHPVRTREFSYQNFPQITATEGLIGKTPLRTSDLRALFFEIDAKAFAALQKNKQSFRKILDVNMEALQQDVFQSELPEGAHLLCNPPYDERLQTNLKTLEKNLAQLLVTSKAQSLSLVWPGYEAPVMLGADGSPIKWKQSVKTFNGGLAITLNFWSRSNT